ncbi:acetate/propionate family kinase [Pistricoccus aurantiacus]|uniref:Acetate kinase n=1 Tax=Pistricoccus aurantiacus TaxID=1883414 RepID=A0A5B8SSZ6_9GAMM|nr:acetate/propionate family kinase [Pistricoccus aurantiacus]QEA39127.1 acetate/propionate family kinase [Pistricoccus aurantiacus]
MKDAILILNSGSSSIKFGLYDGDHASLPLIGHGQIEGIGSTPRLYAEDRHNAPIIDKSLEEGCSHGQAMAALVEWGRTREAARDITAVGHRVVHGGNLFSGPVRVDERVLGELDKLNPLAPLHQPHNLAGIRSLAALEPDLIQVACFDTAFHCQLPKVAKQFALPPRLYEDGVRRYGFHGLSYEYMAEILPSIIGERTAAGRVVVAHLGNGASMCALKEGRSIATTMGFTALDGLPMGTRCGNLDPGVVLYLQSEWGMSSAEVAELLYHQSGLLGMSGISNDMRELLASDAQSAKEAIALYVYRINRELGALTAILGGLDAFVFTAGIGEHAAPIRARVCELASWAGIRLDEKANEAHGPRITTEDSAVPVWVVPTDEEWMIARHTQAIVHQAH